ncbi:MAG: transposase [Woeseiaceae bacterium]
MALTLPVTTARVVGIEEYLEHIRAHVALKDTDSLAASAPMLRALANDRSLVVRELNNRVESFLADGAIPSAQALLIGRGDGFYVRAGIWPAIADMTSGRTYQDQFAYNLAHDHNFTFLTVNYLGPGYETEIYEYDFDKVEGYVGEAVDLRFLEKVRFGTGTVMLYRASRDVHVQYAPTELTITLNLMVANPEVGFRDQYFFDLASRTIASYPPELAASSRVSLLNLAGYLGDTNTPQLLSDLAAKHPCRRTRLTAFEAWCRQQPDEAASIWEKASSDPAPLVANTARRRLRDLESA